MSMFTRLQRLMRQLRRLEEIEFCHAMERYLRLKGEDKLAWDELLLVVKALGYRKVVPADNGARPHSE